jgi:hypothetical protein
MRSLVSAASDTAYPEVVPMIEQEHRRVGDPAGSLWSVGGAVCQAAGGIGQSPPTWDAGSE